MSGFIITALVVLLFIVVYQMAKASEYASVLMGEEKSFFKTNRLMAWLLLIFFLLGLYGLYKNHEYFMGKMLPVAASEQGLKYEFMLKLTLILTGIVFFATQAMLFWFSFLYQAKPERKAYFYPHNSKLEIVWTTVPALTLMILVAIGLKNWLTITDKAPANAESVQVVGKQFNWVIRYPGPDGVFGKTDFRLIDDGNNILGLDWNDPASKDDIIIQNGELHLVKERPSKLIINSRDVIHDVGLAHFRMKMDAVPGVTTTLWFTPTITTKEMKDITHNPDFVYEISCDQMCGKGHYSMRGTVVVETSKEHAAWLKQQQSYYSTTHSGTAPATDSAAAPAAVTMK